MTLQKISYTPENSGTEVIEAIRSRVRHIGDRIITIHEVPKASPFTNRIIVNEIKRLSQGWDSFDLIVDFKEMQRHDAETRRAIEDDFKEIENKLKEMVFIIGGNFVVRASLTFVIRAIGHKVSKVCGSVDEGVAFIISKRQPHEG